MVEFKLVEKLLYQSEEGSVEGEFIIGDDTLWASQKLLQKFLEQVLKIYPSISAI